MVIGEKEFWRRAGRGGRRPPAARADYPTVAVGRRGAAGHVTVPVDRAAVRLDDQRPHAAAAHHRDRCHAGDNGVRPHGDHPRVRVRVRVIFHRPNNTRDGRTRR